MIEKRKRGLAEHGQLYSTDALLSLIIFAFALAIISGMTSQLNNQSQSALNAEYLSLATKRVVQALFFSPGDPWDWHTRSDYNSVRQIGLLGSGGEISALKWSAFRDWNSTDYAGLKQGLGIPDKNFYLVIWDTNRNTLSVAGTAPIDTNSVSVMNVPSMYGGKPVIVQTHVYG